MTVTVPSGDGPVDIFGPLSILEDDVEVLAGGVELAFGTMVDDGGSEALDASADEDADADAALPIAEDIAPEADDDTEAPPLPLDMIDDATEGEIVCVIVIVRGCEPLAPLTS